MTKFYIACIFLVSITVYTECPTQRLTTSDQILKIEKSHMAKSKPCFEILELKSFRWHLETWENQIGSIFKFKIIIKKNNKKRLAPYHLDLHHHHPAKFHPTPPPPPLGNWNCYCHARGWWWCRMKLGGVVVHTGLDWDFGVHGDFWWKSGCF